MAHRAFCATAAAVCQLVLAIPAPEQTAVGATVGLARGPDSCSYSRRDSVARSKGPYSAYFLNVNPQVLVRWIYCDKNSFISSYLPSKKVLYNFQLYIYI